jgi:hypothetical protein
MNWFEAHAYLAAWLALPVAIIIGVIQNAKTRFQKVDWPRSLIYVVFLSSLGVAFTPTFAEGPRSMADMLLVICLMIIAADRKPR